MQSLDQIIELVKTDAFREEVRVIFFEAMNAGWAANDKKEGSIAELPGSKTLPYARGAWAVIDTYLITPLSTWSGGITVISYEGTPVWMMQYFGHYDDLAIPCLKAALMDAYSRQEFNGGRGKNLFKHEGLEYHNSSESNYFELFRGIEHVYDTSAGIKNFKKLGWHVYQGGMLLDRPSS